MLKYLKVLLLIQIPIAVCIFLGIAFAPTQNASLYTQYDHTSAPSEVYLQTSNKLAYIVVNESIVSGLASAFAKTREHFLLGFGNSVALEQLTTNKAVQCFEAIVVVLRFTGPDIVFPFHYFF